MTMKMGRRDFMQSSMAAGAGLWLAQAQGLRAQAQNSAETLNVAIIGVGAQGRVLLNSCVKISNLNFVAVCDIWEYSRTYGQRYLMKFGHKPEAYEDYRELLAKHSDLDAVIVATPDFVHAEHSNACLEKGINVYCEKMMSNDIEEARSMVAAMKKSGKLMQIGHQRRSNPRYQHVYDKLIKTANLPGRITNVNGQWNRAVGEDLGWPEKYTIPSETLAKYGYENMHQFRNWRWFKKYGGGPISDLGAHQIDIYNWFLGGPPKNVIAGGGTDYYEGYEWQDNVMAIYEYDTEQGPVRAFYQVLTTTSAGGGYYESFMGTDGTINVSENPSFTKVYREARIEEEKWKKWIDLKYIRQDAAAAANQAAARVDVRETAPQAVYDLPIVFDKPIHMPHLENFFAAVRGEAELNCPADHAFESEVAVFKVNEAVAAKRMIEITAADLAVPTGA
jgi:predicted dehydrogenase